MSKQIFGTGVLRVGAPGATPLTSANKVATIQDMSLDTSIQRVELMETPSVSIYSVDRGDHSGKTVFDISANDVQLAIQQYAVGATITSGGSGTNNVATITATSKPQYCRVELDVVDNDTGNLVNFVAEQCKMEGLSTSFKNNAFAEAKFKINCYPDASQNVLMRTDN